MAVKSYMYGCKEYGCKELYMAVKSYIYGCKELYVWL